MFSVFEWEDVAIMSSLLTVTNLSPFQYGLPLSRLYARYFHGDLILNSFDGYGTDAIVYLKTRNDHAVELLPVFNKTSTKQYKAAQMVADWTDPNSTMNRHYNPHHHNQAVVVEAST